jgi:hypothetical protein
MAKNLVRLKMLVSCTSELDAERGLIQRIVADVNRAVEDAHGVTIRPIDWRRDVVPGVASYPQQVVNLQTVDYEIYLGMLGGRFGTPTPKAGSGTEEEFNAAYAKFRTDPTSVRLLFYFRTGVAAGLMDLDPNQLRRVQEFRARLGKEAGVLYCDFASAEEFIQVARDHLLALIANQWNGSRWGAVPGLEPSANETVQRLVEPGGMTEAPEDEPTLLDLRVRSDEAFESAMAAVRDIAELMSASADVDRQWLVTIQGATKSGVTPRAAQALINSKAADFGKRAKLLRELRAKYRSASSDFFSMLSQVVEMQIATGLSTADEVRAGLRKITEADALVRAARDVYSSMAVSVAALPEVTREFRMQKRAFMREVEQLAADIGAWLDSSAGLRSRFMLDEPRGAV